MNLHLKQFQATFLPRLLSFVLLASALLGLIPFSGISIGLATNALSRLLHALQLPAEGPSRCRKSSGARRTTGTRSCETNPLGAIKFKDSTGSSGSPSNTNCWKLGKSAGKVSQALAFFWSFHLSISPWLCQRLNLGLVGLWSEPAQPCLCSDIAQVSLNV